MPAGLVYIIMIVSTSKQVSVDLRIESTCCIIRPSTVSQEEGIVPRLGCGLRLLGHAQNRDELPYGSVRY
jgi:hypothetical protein